MRLLTHTIALAIGIVAGYQGHKNEADITKYIRSIQLPQITTPARAGTVDDLNNNTLGLKFGTPKFQIAVPITDPTGRQWECTQSIRTIEGFRAFDQWQNPPAQKFKLEEPKQEEPAAPVPEDHSTHQQ